MYKQEQSTDTFGPDMADILSIFYYLLFIFLFFPQLILLDEFPLVCLLEKESRASLSGLKCEITFSPGAGARWSCCITLGSSVSRYGSSQFLAVL